ncbi:MAG: pilus (MSHA type) biogenesis protein MshL [Cellvibrionaceae bacterium]
MFTFFITLLLLSLITGCSHVADNYQPSKGHISNDRDPGSNATIPAPVTTSAALPLPEPEVVESVHTVVVSDVSVKELLFALTRDADLNLDIDEDVNGRVTLNAIDQPFSAILDRIARSTNLRYEKVNQVLRVQRDRPFLRNYRIDYLNISRSSETSVSVSTELGSTGTGDSSEGNNSSRTEVSSVSENNFWDTLSSNISAIISDEPEISSGQSEGVSEEASESTEEAVSAVSEAPESSGASGNRNLVVNKEAGIIAVRATQNQHKAVDQFLSEVLLSAQRQVLIEATIAEVRLNDSYQAGIDWSSININGDVTQSITQAVTDTTLSGFTFNFSDIGGGGDQLNFTLRALETFGDVSIVSSPKVMALNNQTALLKVVDNLVYFTVDVEVEQGEDGADPIVVYESEVNTVPVGFVMTVTPFINQDQAVTLNVRPTISRVVGQARDPNPVFEEFGISNDIPIVQVREVESVLKVNSGDVAVIGGLMQDEISESTDSVPLLGKVPLLGPLFRYSNDNSTKTELVIFLKPVVINHASLNTDLAPYKRYLPSRSQ